MMSMLRQPCASVEVTAMVAVTHEDDPQPIIRSIRKRCRVHHVFESLLGAHVSGVQDRGLAPPAESTTSLGPVPCRLLDVRPVGDDGDPAQADLDHCAAAEVPHDHADGEAPAPRHRASAQHWQQSRTDSNDCGSLHPRRDSPGREADLAEHPSRSRRVGRHVVT